MPKFLDLLQERDLLLRKAHRLIRQKNADNKAAAEPALATVHGKQLEKELGQRPVVLSDAAEAQFQANKTSGGKARGKREAASVQDDTMLKMETQMEHATKHLVKCTTLRELYAFFSANGPDPYRSL